MVNTYKSGTDGDIHVTAVREDVSDGVTTAIVETGTYQSTAGGGITISSTNTRPVTYIFDDNGVLLGAADYRTHLSRVLLTIDQSNAITLNASRSQIKMLDGIDISSANAVVAPIQGYFELAGTGARTLTGHIAGVRSAIEEGASGTTTIAASSYYAGFEATLNSTRTYTVTGDMAAFMCNISGGTSVWPVGLLIDGSATTVGISIGSCATSAISFGVSAGKVVDAASSVSVYGGGTSGDALVLFGSSADAGQKITITGATGTAVTGLLSVTSTETTADSFSIVANSNTSGSLIKASSTSAVMAAGYLMELDHSVTGDVFSVQTDSPFVSVSVNRNDNTTGTATENYDMVSFSRTNNNSAAGTMTLQGSVLKLAMVATDSGTMTNSVSVLEIVNTNTTVDTDGSNGVSITGIANVFAVPTLTNTVNLFDFGAAAGCVVLGTGVGQDLVDSAAGAVNADGHLTIDVNGTPYYIPVYDTLET